MPLELIHLPADARFWPTAAARVCAFAKRQGAAELELQDLTWLVGGVHAGLARSALSAALGQRAFIPPRITTLADWIGQSLHSGMPGRIEIFAALRANAWVRANFGAQPAALWALARAVTQLGDELSWAAVDGPDDLDRRLRASLAQHYRRRAARALEPQAQLVLQLWRARLAEDDGPALTLRALAARADAAVSPLVYCALDFRALNSSRALDPSHIEPGQVLLPWEQAFLQRYARRAPVMVLVPELAAVLERSPLLAAAWPELAAQGEAAETGEAIAQRADALRARGAALPARLSTPLSIVAAASLEEEAVGVARQVLDWLRAGLTSVALVALDRLTARRVRALLERAQVNVRDETGWKLSTTSAAAVVMRWFELVADDLYWRDLLDWLKSGFALSDRPNKAREVAVIERAIRATGALQGTRAMIRALEDHAAASANSARSRSIEEPADSAVFNGAREVLALIAAQVQATQRAGFTLAAHARSLNQALDALGMRVGLAADPVGRCVLQELESLEADLEGSAARATLDEFRALLGARFEEVSYIDRQVESQVVLVSLTATWLRHFDAALLIGADARHLPSAANDTLFMSDAVRGELGLHTAETAVRAQTSALAALLASTPRVVATWHTHDGVEPNLLSPLLDRLQFVSMRACGNDLARAAGSECFEVKGSAAVRPAPNAGRLLHGRLSASQAQSLVDCPYQFYARRLLGLTEPDDVIEMPDKRDFGEALHEVLRRFHRHWGGVDFSRTDRDQLAASLLEFAQAAFGAQLQRRPGLLAFQRRFEGLIEGYIDWLQGHAAAGWRWQAGEEKRTRTLALRAGEEIELTGRLDRVDTMKEGPDGERVLVLDYKARAAADLKRGLAEPGEDIQLPFYGMLLAQRVDAAVYLSFDRARDDDPGVRTVEPPQEFGALMQSVCDRLLADVQRIADGAPLPANGSETICSRCEMRGLCRRDYWAEGGAADDRQQPTPGEAQGRSE